MLFRLGNRIKQFSFFGYAAVLFQMLSQKRIKWFNRFRRVGLAKPPQTILFNLTDPFAGNTVTFTYSLQSFLFAADAKSVSTLYNIAEPFVRKKPQNLLRG